MVGGNSANDYTLVIIRQSRQRSFQLILFCLPHVAGVRTLAFDLRFRKACIEAHRMVPSNIGYLSSATTYQSSHSRLLDQLRCPSMPWLFGASLRT
jgi:hypothetical protein